MKAQKSTTSSRRFRAGIVCVIMFLFILLGLVTNSGVIAHAEERGVLTELQRDETFNIDEYPRNDSDFSLQVIQLAETMSDTLVVYVYQPAAVNKGYRASSIRFTVSSGADADFSDYALKYLSSSGVFYKYVVEDFTVSDDATREYGIVCLHRKFINGVDKISENGDVITEIPYAVNQLWTFKTEDGITTCSYDYYETVSVTAKYCGIVRYYDGTEWVNKYTDSHFIAFNTDEPIINLLSAKVTFSSIQRLIREDTMHDEVVYEDVAPAAKREEHEVTIYRDDEVSNNPVKDVFLWSWGGKKYTWKRIQTVEEFKASEDISKIKSARLDGCKWILRFYESSFAEGSGGPHMKQTVYTKVYDETILSLSYEIAGQVYNVGVVDDKRIEDSDPIKVYAPKSWPWWVYAIIVAAIILFIILLPALAPSILTGIVSIFKLLLKGLWWLIKHIGIALWWLISLPFRAIAALVRKIKGDDGGAA